ncbi:Wzz/FepE/Etk N-terminal domain-containing protein, partial [Clostridium perfringens]|uniref:Wzz/FepE/Etk N-terminal domain-containing protein n=1 Tax=Clostridium perfringens TaxID=1502 RepID=UPI003754F0BC
MENNLNLLTLIKLLLKNRRFLISITALAALVGASVSFLLTPRLKATASALA